jgi:hypothetical protein
MKRTESVASFIVRLFLTFIILVAAFWYFDPINELDREADSLNMLIYGIYLPIVFTGFTVAVCLVIGLPIRFIKKINNWWYSNFGWQIIILAIGLLLLFLSGNGNFQEKEVININGETEVHYFSNIYLSLTGWLLLAFSILHISFSGVISVLLKKISSKDDWTSDPGQ